MINNSLEEFHNNKLRMVLCCSDIWDQVKTSSLLSKSVKSQKDRIRNEGFDRVSKQTLGRLKAFLEEHLNKALTIKSSRVLGIDKKKVGTSDLMITDAYIDGNEKGLKMTFDENFSIQLSGETDSINRVATDVKSSRFTVKGVDGLTVLKINRDNSK